MPSHGWQNIDQAHLLQKVVLLQLLNRTPEKPSEISVSDLEAKDDSLFKRSISIQHEKELAESFAFLAATTNDPKKVVAACVEEGEKNRCLIVRLAINNGSLNHVIVGFERMAKIFKRVVQAEQSSVTQEQHALLHEVLTMNQNRILARLRSRHAKLQCNFKREKMQQPKVIPQLYRAVNGQALAQTSEIVPLLSTALKADVEKLHELFAKIENLTTPEAKSSPGLEILVQMVITCHHIHDRRILHQVLASSPQLDPSSRASITMTITKLSRYSSVSRFLLQAARKYPIFRRVRISSVCFRAPKLPITELDSMTAELVDSLLDKPQFQKLTSKFYGSSSSAIKDHLRQEATSAIPVHAEVQLLFHYEQNSCKVPPRIICSSKQACFLCDLFFKIHGRFTIPSTHGRLYEKWAIPEAVKSIEPTDKDILTTLRSFVLAINNALLREIQLTRKSYPNPFESIILHSAVCLPSNQSTTSARILSASQEPVRSPSPISASKNDSTLRTGSPVPYAGMAATTPTTERRVDALRLHSEASSTATIRAPSPPNTLPEYVVSSVESTSSNTLRVSLKQGQPIRREMFSTSHSLQVRTPYIHLTISQDELFYDHWSQKTSHDLLAAGCGHYWLTLEYLSDRSVPQGDNVPFVNLLDVPIEREMILDYSMAEWPRVLRVCSKGDIISITYSKHKPVEGMK